MRSLVIVPIFLLALSVSAQDLERVLLPVSAPDVDGGFGSRWSTEHFVRNDGLLPLILVRDDCAIGPACQNVIQPGTTFRADPSLLRPYLWLEVESSASDQIYFSTVVRDIAGSIEPWGTEIPAVRDREFRRDRVQLLNVPSALQFRKNLRVYLITEPEQGEQPDVELMVRVFDMSSELAAAPDGEPGPSVLLGEKAFRVRGDKFDPGDYLGVFCLECVFEGLDRAERLRVEVSRTGGTPARVWALLTATNNETQHVTIFTPE